MKKVALLLLAGSLFVFNSCTKTGPVGPQGPTGAQGPQGNANVLGTKPFIPNWEAYNIVNRWYSATFSDPDITADVVDRGIVQIFKQYGTNTWTNLPDISGKTSTVYDFFDGGFTLYVQNSDGTQPSSPQGTSYRVVIVYPSYRLTHPTTNWNDYDQAMAAIAEIKSAPAAANQ